VICAATGRCRTPASASPGFRGAPSLRHRPRQRARCDPVPAHPRQRAVLMQAGPQFLLPRSWPSSYHPRMTKLLEEAIEACGGYLRTPRMTSPAPFFTWRGVSRGGAGRSSPFGGGAQGMAQAKRREFATDDEVEAASRRFDR